MKLVKIILFFTLLTTLSGCATLFVNQSGMTLGKKTKEINIGVDYLGNSEGGGLIGTVPIIFPVVGINYGLTNNLDIGCMINTSAHLSAMTKYQVIGTKESLFASSIGIRGGFQLGELNGITNLYSLNIQSFNSIHTRDDRLAIFLAPQLIYLRYKEDNSPDNIINSAAYTLGIIFGEWNKFSFGISQFLVNSNNNSALFTFGISHIL